MMHRMRVVSVELPAPELVSGGLVPVELYSIIDDIPVLRPGPMKWQVRDGLR